MEHCLLTAWMSAIDIVQVKHSEHSLNQSINLLLNAVARLSNMSPFSEFIKKNLYFIFHWTVKSISNSVSRFHLKASLEELFLKIKFLYGFVFCSGVVTPIKRKSRIHSLVFGDFGSVLVLYLVLALTGVFLFKEPRDLYTLNFFDVTDSAQIPPDFIRYFLALFPVFTLSSTFPIVGITLRNNIRTLCDLLLKRELPWAVDKVGLPLVTLLPPIMFALLTDDVQFLVGITGS